MPISPLDIDEFESARFASYAMFSKESAGRQFEEPPHPYRTEFQRDRDRVVHAAAFRRLSGKTQVFTGSMGDYHRTRLTHTMEVASIARTIGRALRLNEDLIETLALLHDIGHPPFGHAGEDALNALLEADGGFSHNRFALTLVEDIERPYPHFRGLNLTRDVLSCQSGRIDKDIDGDALQPLLEAQVVDAADSVTYDAHDIDDAVKLGIVDLADLRQEVPLIAACCERARCRYGAMDEEMTRRTVVHELIDVQVSDLLENSHRRILAGAPSSALAARRLASCIDHGEETGKQKQALEKFLFQRVYRHPQIVDGRREAQAKLTHLFQQLVADPGRLPTLFHERIPRVGERRAVADYLAGMTDHYCLEQFDRFSEP